ncbi:MAG TPA: type VI secretion system tube protein Hcp [Terracidiphilus sp.]|nr:type VI secretion system tube protein Hcp [Terracidiphilus sp.]
MAVNYFLKLPNVEGESMMKGFDKQIEIFSWSFGASNASGVEYGSGSGKGNVQFGDFSCMINLDKSSPKLLNGVCEGKHYATATFAGVKSGAKQEKPYLKFTFDELFVTGFQVSGSGGAGDSPMVSLSFTFAKIKYEYGTQDKEGNVTAAGETTFDLKTRELA